MSESRIPTWRTSVPPPPRIAPVGAGFYCFVNREPREPRMRPQPPRIVPMPILVIEDP